MEVTRISNYRVLSMKESVQKKKKDRDTFRLCCYAGYRIFGFIVVLASVLEITLASLFLCQCRLENAIPLFFLVRGGVWLSYAILAYSIICWTRHEKKDVLTPISIFGGCVLLLFDLIWFVIGCMWVYGYKSQKGLDSESTDFCGVEFYTLAYYVFSASWCLTIVKLFLAIINCCSLNRETPRLYAVVL